MLMFLKFPVGNGSHSSTKSNQSTGVRSVGVPTPPTQPTSTSRDLLNYMIENAAKMRYNIYTCVCANLFLYMCVWSISAATCILQQAAGQACVCIIPSVCSKEVAERDKVWEDYHSTFCPPLVFPFPPIDQNRLLEEYNMMTTSMVKSCDSTLCSKLLD